MKSIMLIGCLCVLLAGGTNKAFGAQELTDAEMDQVTAGTLSVGVADGKLNFQLAGDNGSTPSVTGSGNVTTVNNPAPAGTPASYILLRDNAQSNLHSFVNINAVNSKVQVQLNLVVNINSTVNTIHQTNAAPAF